MKSLTATLVILFSLFSFAGLSQESLSQEKSNTPFSPQVPKAVGAPHPEGNEFMRINHPKLLLHDRDQALRLGNREIDYSLKECIACHAVEGEDKQPVTYEDPQYFCRVCHDFVAVEIDCFTCHQAKPDDSILQRLLLERPVPLKQSQAELDKYLQAIEQSGNSPPDDKSKQATVVAQ